jgi:hypothetical protein
LRGDVFRAKRHVGGCGGIALANGGRICGCHIITSCQFVLHVTCCIFRISKYARSCQG